MITVNDYIKWYKNEKKKMLDIGRYGSEPIFLFKLDDWDRPFNPDNWNGGDILRHFLYDNAYRISEFEVKYYCIDDQTTFFFFDKNNFYEITWYKNRGRTDMIKKNGEPIYLDEYIDLCNELNITLN